MQTDEQVLVVDRRAFFGGDWPQGFVPLDGAAADRFCGELEAAARFESRARAERETAWKQCIPYCVIARGSEVFCVERGRQQGEGRLHGKLSIGLGGHIGIEDSPPHGAVRRGLLRELDEELILPARHAATPRFVGLLNDDSNAVGKVHVGLVHLLQLGGSAARIEVHVREISKMVGGFRPLAASGQAWQDGHRLESWSAVLLGAVPPLLHSQA